ncbi:carboxypeptidase-like regulatory domain-containing protein [Labilibaculum manganireducens]|uniref:carboxypeptidase-like regulatory domain-containing protein n=1 Tax=Labilibaculum manganireducens TaxID=1940525 RepID=UPI0029F4895E|nr:carboxypeptidase-like regulatory domain-containing protein [Labilibaculum manganireducens]
MYKFILALLVTSIAYTFSTLAQTKLNCRLEDSQHQAIPYASIKIMPGLLGTITNADGYFEIKYTSTNELKNIQISCIGYQTKIFPIDSLFDQEKKKQEIHLTLKKQSYQLQEVIVGKQEILKDAKQIFANAIAELPHLLDDSPHIGKYYFRQSHQLDTSINRLLEAAVSIYDPGINNDIETCKFNIDELQSSLDNRNIDYKKLLHQYLYARKKKKHAGDPRITSNSSYKDPLIQQYLLQDLDHSKALFSKFYIATNMIRGIKKGNRKKSLPINPHFKNGRPVITESFIKEHQFKLDTILMFNNDPVYKIKILPNKRYPNIKYQERSLIPIGIAYIRISDYAFLDLDYGYINNPNYKYSKGKSKYYFHFKVKFKESNKKLYLSYLYSNRFDYNSDLTRRRRLIQELSNTEIINNPDSIRKQLSTLNWKGDQYEKLPYNEKFWKNYFSLLPTQEEQLLKDNLIKKLSDK